MKRTGQSNGKPPSQAGDDNFARPHDGGSGVGVPAGHGHGPGTFDNVFEAAPGADPGDHQHQAQVQHHDPSLYGQGAAMSGGPLPPQPGQEYYRHAAAHHLPHPQQHASPHDYPHTQPGAGPVAGHDPAATDYRYGVPGGTPARQDPPPHSAHLDQQAAAVAAGGVGAPGAAPPASPATGVFRSGAAAPPPGTSLPQHAHAHPGASAWHPNAAAAAHAQHPQHLQPHVPPPAASTGALLRSGVPPYDAASAQAQYQATAAAGAAAAAQYPPPRDRQPYGATAGYYYNYPHAPPGPGRHHQPPHQPTAPHAAPPPTAASRYGTYPAAAAANPYLYPQAGYFPPDAYASQGAPTRPSPFRMGNTGVLPPGAAAGVPGAGGQPGMAQYEHQFHQGGVQHGSYIKQTNSNDVLCGRGGATNSHAGNRAFRKLVKQFKDKYLRAKKKEKPNVAAEVVEIIRSLEPAGRFLKKDKDSGWWIDIGDARAKEKTSQALREGAPAIRKKLNDMKEAEEERQRDQGEGESDDISSSPEKTRQQQIKPESEGEGDLKIPAVAKVESVSAFSPLQDSIDTGAGVDVKAAESSGSGSDAKKADNSEKEKSVKSDDEDDRKPAAVPEGNSRKRPSPTRSNEGESPQKRAKDELSEKEKNLYDVFDPPRPPLRKDGSDDDKDKDKDDDKDKNPDGDQAEI